MNVQNEFIFNHPTMRVIVQHYLDTILLREEVNVTVSSIDYNSQTKEFTARVGEETLVPEQGGEDEQSGVEV